jgi:curved DNA-binding protein CbpA
MKQNLRKDYYDILQVSPGAHPDSIDKMFRHFAQRYHPDNATTGDREMFELVIEAHDVLKDAALRAQYDIHRRHVIEEHAILVEDLLGKDEFESDAKVQSTLLSMLYFKCREDIRNPGLGSLEMLKLVDIPREQLDFHLWYLRGKGWISRTDEGLFAITVEGVDQAADTNNSEWRQKRIEDNSEQPIIL